MSRKSPREPGGMDSKPPPSSQDDCETLRDLIPAYSVGATDPDETRLVEALLPRCPEVADELREYVQFSRALLYAPVAEPPPAYLGERIRASIGGPARSPRRQAGFWERFLGGSEQVGTGSASRLAPVIALLALVLLVATNLYWLNQVTTLRDREQEIVALVEQQRTLLTALGSPSSRRIELASTTPEGEGRALVAYNPGSDLGLLTADLPPLPPGRAYQFWLIRGEQPVGAGVFDVNESGLGVLVFETLGGVEAFDVVAITDEPAGGSPLPTTDPLVAGQVEQA